MKTNYSFVWDQIELSYSRKLALLSIAKLIKKKGDDSISTTAIQNESKFNNKTIFLAVKELERKNYISVIRYPGKTNKFQILINNNGC
jgi:uncharacterized membrane protein